MIISTWMCGGSIRSKCPDGPSVAFTRCTGSSVPIATSFSRYLVSFSIFTTWSGGNAVGDGHQHAPWCSSSLCSYSMRAGRGRLALRRCQLFPSFQYFWWIFHLCQRFFFLSLFLFFSFSLMENFQVPILWIHFLLLGWIEFPCRVAKLIRFPFFPLFFLFFCRIDFGQLFQWVAGEFPGSDKQRCQIGVEPDLHIQTAVEIADCHSTLSSARVIH